MTGRVRLALALAGTLLLTGCAGDARGQLRDGVAEVTEAANQRDADGVRRAADDLLDRLDDAVRSGEVATAEAARIGELARLLRERADALSPAAPEEPVPAPPSTSPPETSPAPSPAPAAPDAGQDDEDDDAGKGDDKGKGEDKGKDDD